MAHKKAGGSTSLGRDSISKRLGVKIFGGQKAWSGNVIIRQRGTKYRPGENTRLGGDSTIYASSSGTVEFQKKQFRSFDGALKTKTVVHVK